MEPSARRHYSTLDNAVIKQNALVALHDAWHAAEPDAGHDASAAEWQAMLKERTATTRPAGGATRDPEHSSDLVPGPRQEGAGNVSDCATAAALRRNDHALRRFQTTSTNGVNNPTVGNTPGAQQSPV